MLGIRQDRSTEFLCLHKQPQYLRTVPGEQGQRAYFYGTKYRPDNLGGQDAPCAVCYTPTRNIKITIPARTSCPPSWTRDTARKACMCKSVNLVHYHSAQAVHKQCRRCTWFPACPLLVYLSVQECTSWKLCASSGSVHLVHYHSTQAVHNLHMQAFLAVGVLWLLHD